MGLFDIFKIGRKTESKTGLPLGTSVRQRTVYGPKADCLRNSAFWSCVTLIADKLATLPLTPHEEGSYKAMTRDRALYYLLEQPNRYMGHHDFIFVMAFNYLFEGEAIAIKQLASNGIVNALYPVSPKTVHRSWADGEQYFTVNGTNGTATYRREDLLIIRWTPSSYDEVFSPVDYAREGIELSEKAKSLQGEWYEGGSVLGKFIKVPPSAYDTMREQLKETFDNSRKYRNIVIPNTIEIEPIKADGEDIGRLIEAQSWDVSEVSRRFHVPKAYLGDTSGGYGNTEQQAIQLVQECLQPICKTWEMAINADVCRPGEYVKFDLQSLMRGDHATRQSWYQTMLTHGVYSVNEVRALEDLEPIGKEGDVHYFQSGFANLKDIEAGAFTKTATPTETPKDNKDESLVLLPGILESMISSGQSITPVASSLGVGDEKWLASYEEAMRKRVSEGSDKTDEAYRCLNSLLVKLAGKNKVKYTVDGLKPDEKGYFNVEGKKFRNPPFFAGDKRIIEVDA